MKTIIHRDLKPHNLLLTKDGGKRLFIKVADFGFARSMDPTDLAQTLCGSPLYMVFDLDRNYHFRLQKF
jgi:serine/threonine-protein kinase ULK/ATG1